MSTVMKSDLNFYLSTSVFESAQAEEISLPIGVYRRPIRREDVKHIDFTKSVDAETVHLLPALIANRVLYTIYERQGLRWPPAGRPEEINVFLGLFTSEHRLVADRLRYALAGR